VFQIGKFFCPFSRLLRARFAQPASQALHQKGAFPHLKFAFLHHFGLGKVGKIPNTIEGPGDVEPMAVKNT
jgi:hypothetical protein